MKSKDFIKQRNVDKLTLKELYNLDDLNLKKFSKFGKINLLSLVIVQMQAYLSSSIINKKTKPYDKFVNFPFANSRYLNKNLQFHEKVNKKLFKMNVQKIKTAIRSFVPFANISTLNVFSDVYEDIKKELNKNFIIRKTARFIPIHINSIDEQIKILDEYLKSFAKKNNIKNTSYSENFIKYIKPYFSYEKFKIDNSHFLFVGTNSNLENRVTSANYLLNKRTVISFNHANYNTLIIDEPHQEYAEHVFCDYYIDYGSIKKNKKLLKSNYLAPKKIINLSNPKLVAALPKKRVLNNYIIYVPDSFHGDKRHGPYREMDDKKYYKFQKKLISSKKNILIKLHPKGKNFSQVASGKDLKYYSKKIINKKLSNIINDYPLFVTDRISQAFFDIARGQSKILYFNIGRRKIHKEFIKEVKKRAYIVNVDPYSITQKNFVYHIKRALNFNIKKSKIMEIACIKKKKKKEKFFDIFKT